MITDQNTHECMLETIDSISKFTKEFVVSEECVKTYLEQLKLLELEKKKRKKRLEKPRLPIKCLPGSKPYQQTYSN